jgi:hypothetical protein
MAVHHNMLGKIPVSTERTFSALANELPGATSCLVHENILRPGVVGPGTSTRLRKSLSVSLVLASAHSLEGRRRPTNPEVSLSFQREHPTH